jgi:two-component system cell cycle sensor histidine kinase/response regulator CckA
LVIEDQFILAELERKLSDQGYESAGTVSSGEEALSAIEALAPDLVFIGSHFQQRPEVVRVADEIRRRFNIPVVLEAPNPESGIVARSAPPQGLVASFANSPLSGRDPICADSLELQRSPGDVSVWSANAIKAAGDGMVILNSAGRVQYLNPAAQRLTGCSLKDAVGHHFSEVLSFEYRGAPLTDDLVRLATLSDEAISLGSDLTLSARGEVRRRVEGEIAATEADRLPATIVLTLRDVTQRKWEEHQREQAKTVRAIERLAETAAFRFNNLLTTIMGNSELLLNTDGLPDETRTSISQIHGAAVDAAGVASQLSALSRKHVTFPQELSLNALVSEFVPVLAAMLPADIEIGTTLDPALRPVSADRAELEQALFHLVMNARDALPSGGRIAISTENVVQDANERFNRKRTFVSVKVRDTGLGMSNETAERIFEPFFTSRSDGQHAGLGLSIVQGIIRDGQGYLNVRSEPGAGSELEFCLPAVEEDPFAYLAAAPGDRGAPTTSTILLVEDDHAIRLLMRKILEEREYQVVEAEHGEDALLVAQLHGSRIDLLITDVTMPGMSGLDLARQFGTFHPETKILLVSGHTAETLGATSSLPADIDFLPKPFTRVGLLAKVEHFIGTPERAARPTECMD